MRKVNKIKIKNNKFKNINGITIHSLVITVIVLLILAGVSINLVLGENGIITNSIKAEIETEKAKEKEWIVLAVNEGILESEKFRKVDKEAFIASIKKYAGADKIEISDTGYSLELEFIESKRAYEIFIDGRIDNIILGEMDKYPGDITKDNDGNSLSGTKESPYQINCIEDLVSLSNMVAGTGKIISDGKVVDVTKSNTMSGKYIRLMRNLNFDSKFSYVKATGNEYGDLNGDGLDGNELKNEMKSGTGFHPIGLTRAANYVNFQGNFDGQNYGIYGLYENREGVAALFGNVANGSIKNLNVYGEITSSNNSVGSIAVGVSNTTIENCTNYANIETTGVNPTYIADGGTSYTNSYAGGIAASIDGSTVISNCNNYGTIKSKKTYAAGISAFPRATIKNCNNYGNIISEGSAAAGIGGFQYAGTTLIMNCVNYGDITSNYAGGGIWGHQIAGKVSILNCYNLGNIEGTGTDSCIGGIYGKTYVTTTTIIRNSYSKGEVSGRYKGGILGYQWGGNVVTKNNYFIDNVTNSVGNNNNAFGVAYKSLEKYNVLDSLNQYISDNLNVDDTNLVNTQGWNSWTIENEEIIFSENNV